MFPVQVHDFIWNFEKRVVKAEDLPHYSPADKLPYVVHIVKKGARTHFFSCLGFCHHNPVSAGVSSLYYYHSNPLLQYTDEAVDLTGSTLHVQWADANAACFDEDAADVSG